MRTFMQRAPRLWLVLMLFAGAACGLLVTATEQHPLLLLALLPVAGVLAWRLARRLPWVPWRRAAPQPYGQMHFANRREERRYTRRGHVWAWRWEQLRTRVRSIARTCTRRS